MGSSPPSTTLGNMSKTYPILRRLADSGYRVRAYVTYGPEWLPYTMRRLRERRENLFFVIKNIFD